MRVNLKWVVAAALVLLAFSTDPQQLRGQGLADFELDLFGGVSFLSDESFEIGPPQSDDPVPFNFEIDSAGRVGLRLNFLTADRWGTEFYYGYSSTTASYILRDDPTVRLDLPIQTHGLGINVLYYPMGNGYPLATSGRLTPFVSGGLGAAISRPTSEAKAIATDPLQGNLPDIIESSEVAYSYGVGAKYRLTRIFGVRGDVRGYLSRNPTFGLPTESTDPNASVIPLKGYIHDTEISIGVIINFGSRP